jgi:hypothetical protein
VCQNLLKKWNSFRKQHVGKTMENEINELELMKACKYLGAL